MIGTKIETKMGSDNDRDKDRDKDGLPNQALHGTAYRRP